MNALNPNFNNRFALTENPSTLAVPAPPPHQHVE